MTRARLRPVAGKGPVLALDQARSDGAGNRQRGRVAAGGQRAKWLAFDEPAIDVGHRHAGGPPARPRTPADAYDATIYDQGALALEAQKKP